MRNAPGLFGAALLTLSTERLALTTVGRAMLPTALYTPRVRVVGLEVGEAARLVLSERVLLHGYVGGDVSAGLGAAASLPRLGAAWNAGVEWAPWTWLALVLEAYPKEKRMVPVARLALELTKPTAEGRFCVQMADQGFIPLGNGAPHQMQLFLQLDCGGTLVSSSQSFLKEKFNFSKSLARPGTGTQVRQVAGHRVPVFWLMGNSDTGTYLTDEALEKGAVCRYAQIEGHAPLVTVVSLEVG